MTNGVGIRNSHTKHGAYNTQYGANNLVRKETD